MPEQAISRYGYRRNHAKQFQGAFTMHFGKTGWTLLLAGILATGGFCIPWAACPTWVKKDQVTTGTLTNAPAGWYVYSRTDMNGLFKSTLKSFSQQQIPNTQNDKPICVEITYDGQWIVLESTVYSHSHVKLPVD
jgi:hypothetical protein